MQIIIEIPDMKFKVGDVIYLPNENNNFGIYLKIFDYKLTISNFDITKQSSQYVPMILYSYYWGKLMAGSISDLNELYPLIGPLTIEKKYLEKGIMVGNTENLKFLYNSSDSPKKIYEIIETQRADGYELLKSFNLG